MPENHERWQPLNEYMGKKLPKSIITLIECGNCRARFPIYIPSFDVEKQSLFFLCENCGIIVEVFHHQMTWINKIRKSLGRTLIREAHPRMDLEMILKKDKL